MFYNTKDVPLPMRAMRVGVCVCAKQTFICHFADVAVIDVAQHCSQGQGSGGGDGGGDDDTVMRLPSAYAGKLVQGRWQSVQRHAKSCQS